MLNLQVIDINFDYDSVKKVHTPGLHNSEADGDDPCHPPLSPWVYNDKINDSSSGYQLTQLCHCYNTVCGDKGQQEGHPNNLLSPGASSSEKLPSGGVGGGGGGGRGQEVAGTSQENRVPVIVNSIQYSTAVSL